MKPKKVMVSVADLQAWMKRRPVPDAPNEFSIEGLDYPESLEKWAEEGEMLIGQFQKQLQDFTDLLKSQGYTEDVANKLTEILGGQKQ